MVDPIVVIPATDKVLKIGDATVTGMLDAEAAPPDPMHANWYETTPVAVGTTLIVPLVAWLPEKVPALAEEVVAVQDVAPLELHVRFRA
jgi:hypothetical protein